MADSTLIDSAPMFQCYASWPFFAGAAVAGALAYFIIRISSRRLTEAQEKLLLSGRKNDLLDKTIKLLMESSGEGIALLDDRGRVVSVNAAGEGLLGLTRNEMMGSPWMDIIAWGGGDKAAEALAFSRFLNHIVPIKRRDGTRLSLSINFGQLFEPNNAKAGAVCVFSRAATNQVEDTRRFVDFFDKANIGMGLTGLDFRFTEVNDTLARMFGYPREELIGVKPQDLTHADAGAPNLELQTKNADEELDTYRVEKRYIRKDGALFWGIMSAALIRDADGKPLHYVGQFTDVTELKKAERALMESAKEWAYAMDFFEDAIFILDMDLRVKRANGPFYMMTGLTPEKAIGRNIQEILHHGPEVDCPVCAAQNERREAIITMEADHPANPSGRPIEVMVKMIRDETRKPAAILMGIHDLTRQRAYEAAFRESEETYRTLVSKMREGIVVIQDGVIKFANDNQIFPYGYTEEEVIGSDFMRFISPSFHEDAARRFADRMAGVEVEDTYESRLVRKDGTEVDVAASAASITYEGRPAMLVVARDITEMRRWRETLLESEEKYRTLISQIQEGIIVAQDGQIKLTNEAMAETLGFTVDEVIGVPFYRFLAYESREAVITIYEDRLAGRDAPANYETRLIRKDGSEIDVAVSSGVISFEGRPAVLAAIRDVTDMKQSHARVKESEDRYRQLVENAPIPIFVHADYKILYINPAAVKALGGASPEDFIGKDSLSLAPPELRAFSRKRIERIYKERAATPLAETRLLRLDGAVIDAEILGTPVVFDGKPAAQTIFHDVTERKKGEAALRESEERFRMMFENSPDAMLLAEAETGALLDVNHAAERLFRRPRGEFIGMHQSTLHPPRDDRAIREKFRRRVTGSDPTIPAESAIIRKDGTEAPVEVTGQRFIINGKKVLLGVFRDLTERQKAGEALRESEERYRALVENSNDCVCLLDLEGRYIFMNQRGMEMKGFAGMEDLVGKKCLDLVNQDFQPVMEDAMESAARGQTVHATYTAASGGKNDVWWESALSPILGGDGKVSSILLISRDVTERKMAEEEISGNHEILEAIGEAQIRFIMGEKAERMFGSLLNRITALARSEFGFIGEVQHDDNGAPYLKTYAVSSMSGDKKSKKFLREGFRPGMEFRNLNSLYGAVLTSGEYVISANPATDPRSGGVPEGHPGLTSFLGVPLKRGGEEMVGMIGLANRPGGYDEKTAAYLEPFVATCAQLIEASRIETRRRMAEKAVRDSEALLERLFGTTQIMLALLDTGMNFLKVNNAYAMADGKEVRFFPGKNHFELYPNEENQAIFANVIHTGEPYVAYAKPFVYEANPERGITYWDVHLQAVREADGEISGLLMSLLNVTGRKKAEEQAKIHQRQLIQADKMKSLGILVAGVAHEINNPNSFIAINAPLLKRIWEQGAPIMVRGLGGGEGVLLGGMPLAKALEAAPKLLDGVAEGSRRIQIIVDKLKNFARVEQSATRRPVDLNKAVESAALLTAGLIRKHTHKFAMELEGNLPPIMGSQMEMEQVVINLLSNALQSLRDPDKGVTVTTQFDQEKELVRVIVADEGCGVPAEDLDKVADPFFTTKRDAGGTGLGLSVSFGIVRDHMGVIRFDSKPGAGSTVTLEFPTINGAIR